MLTKYQFPGDKIPIVRGSALKAMNSTSTDAATEEYKCIWELMDAVDSYIPTPDRPIDKPFLMPIEDVFTISGRGTVVTGQSREGNSKGRGRGRDSRIGRDEEDSSDRSGDVQEAAG